jgi:predicted GTPase
MNEYQCIVMGAAGRDFHVFLSFLRGNPQFRVRAFTATQIPFIDQRSFPRSLAGPGYQDDIPIHDEAELPRLIHSHDIDFVFFAYSDIPHADIMHKASLVQAAGASFVMLGPDHTQLAASKPVVSVTATRTGAGKSPLTQWLARLLTDRGKRVAVIRHPMPYGNLDMQRVQRFASPEDLAAQQCTIEEREEYEPHIAAGNVIFAGVDYEKILQEAEKEADVILWDGGNNDMPFYRPNLLIVVADPHRPGHELKYYPGETNARMADVVVINKVGTAKPEDVKTVEQNIRCINPEARIIRADSPVTVDRPEMIKGKKVLVVEDGPTLTHGEMKIGAGHVAATQWGASQIVDPRPYAVGTIKMTFEQYTHVTEVLPAMGYGGRQMAELQDTINAADCDLVLIGTPIDLGALLKINKPTMRVGYELEEKATAALRAEVEQVIA